jgi:hypothetical protein
VDVVPWLLLLLFLFYALQDEIDWLFGWLVNPSGCQFFESSIESQDHAKYDLNSD